MLTRNIVSDDSESLQIFLDKIYFWNEGNPRVVDEHDDQIEMPLWKSIKT